MDALSQQFPLRDIDSLVDVLYTASCMLYAVKLFKDCAHPAKVENPPLTFPNKKVGGVSYSLLKKKKNRTPQARRLGKSSLKI
ncbi:hypothetical protein AV654_28425 [Paenibacillus elgii]|uniref:Uncharacterized protein n=1 Tax=Paenibacillus elgii TaxID=189691 RepID=A0A165QGD4_9BACL|nr:hypothetical protein AV654_28425 [Paenibacillus elgii]